MSELDQGLYQDSSTVILGAISGQELTVDEHKFFQQFPLSGVTLFKRNISQDPKQVQELIASLQDTRPDGSPPLLIAVDQEGGRVSRLKGLVPDLGPAQRLFPGAGPDSCQALHSYGASLAQAIKKLGFNLNFAPVVDVLSRPDNTAIGDRVFDTKPQSVTKRAQAFLSGMQSQGILGCLKHFPGQGDANFDTHHQGATIQADEALLWQRELPPYQALLDQTSFVMASHCSYPALDPTVPASLSRVILKDLLRHKLGFTGVIVSDDMNMAAIAQEQDAWLASLVQSLYAGCELLLVCKDFKRSQAAAQYIYHTAEQSPELKQILHTASTKILALRSQLSI